MADRALTEQLDRAIDRLLVGAEHTGPADPALSGLMEIAGKLRYLPDDRFKARLSRELHVSTAIAPTSAEFAIHTITPFISVPEGDELIEFMKRTFDAEETSRHPHHGPDGFVAGMRIGDSDLFIMAGANVRGQECPAALHVYVKDCDAAYRRALAAGAVVLGAIGEPADRPYGERAAFVSDPFGNYWFIATRVGRDYVGVGLGHVTPCLLPAKALPLIDFLKRAFGAKVEGLHEEGEHMVHAFIRIGDAVLEMAEAEEKRVRQFGFGMHTDDVDALYRRAMAAGATSILPPADQPFGERLAILQDPAGNRWFAAKRIVPVY